MADEIEALLDEAMIGNGTIVLNIDEPTRSILYDGELILGVEGDHQAERICFRVPRYVGSTDVLDLNSSTVKIYINFTNAYNSTYRYECTDKDLDGDYVTFSWLLTRNVTEFKGTVNFTVCAQNIVDVDTNVIWEGDATSENRDGVGTYATYNVPSNIVSHTVTRATIIGECKEYNTTEFVSSVGSVYFDIYVDNSDTAVCTGSTTDGTYTLTTSQLETLKNAKSISVRCDSSGPAEDGDVLNSIYYRVKMELVFDGIQREKVIQNDWNTTPFPGTVLDGIETDEDTLEIVSDETSSMYKLTNDVADLKAQVDTLVTSYSRAEVDILVAKAETNCTTKYTELVNDLVNPVDPMVVALATAAINDNKGNNIASTYLPKTTAAATYAILEESTKVFDEETGIYDGKYTGATGGIPGSLRTTKIYIDSDGEFDYKKGDKIKIYFMNKWSYYPTCQSGVLEFELTERWDTKDRSVITGRGSYTCVLGGQVMVIGAEFNSTAEEAAHIDVFVYIIANTATAVENDNSGKSSVSVEYVYRLRKVTVE